MPPRNALAQHMRSWQRYSGVERNSSTRLAGSSTMRKGADLLVREPVASETPPEAKTEPPGGIISLEQEKTGLLTPRCEHAEPVTSIGA
jgi:hypothetical protein